MRLAVSDYDGTMFHAGALLGDVIGGIRAWRAAGNVFAIATGRDYGMILSEVEKWGIPLDGLVVTNGATVFDAGGAPVIRRDIADSVVPALLSHPAARASMHFQISSAVVPLRVYHTERSWMPKIGVNFTRVSYDESLSFTGLSQVSFAYDAEEECIAWEGDLLREFGAMLTPHRNKATIDITAYGVDKATGIEDLLRIRGWEEYGVVVVGDGGNDLPMIRRFEGYTVPGAQDDVAAAARGMYGDVGEMLRTLVSV